MEPSLEMRLGRVSDRCCTRHLTRILLRKVSNSGTIIMSPSEMSIVVNPGTFHDVQVWASVKAVLLRPLLTLLCADPRYVCARQECIFVL